MDWNELFQSIIYIVLTAILPLVAKYIVDYLRVKITGESEKIENEKLQQYVKDAVDVIGKAVQKVSQTYVDSLKKAGKFDAAAQETAKAAAEAIAIALISKQSKKAIVQLYNDFDEYLDTTIEALVRDKKIEIKKQEKEG